VEALIKPLKLAGPTGNEKHCYRRRTARRTTSVRIWSTAAQLREQVVHKYREQIEVMELEGYSRPTCNKLRQATTRLDRPGCHPQARPTASFVDNTIDFPRPNFLNPEFVTAFWWEVPLFLEVYELPL